jgi:hypothetical protein
VYDGSEVRLGVRLMGMSVCAFQKNPGFFFADFTRLKGTKRHKFFFHRSVRALYYIVLLCTLYIVIALFCIAIAMVLARRVA